MTVMNLDKLEVRLRAKDFALVVYKEVVPHLPADEKWNLASQLKRAVQSIPAQVEKDFPAGYTIREEAEPYILDNLGEDSPDQP